MVNNLVKTAQVTPAEELVSFNAISDSPYFSVINTLCYQYPLICLHLTNSLA